MPDPDRDALPFLRAIAEHPGEPEYRLAFSDWLREHSRDAEADGQAWAARKGLYPDREVGWWWEDCLAVPECHRLPRSFHEPSVCELFGSVDPLKCELAFLCRCAELAWDGACGVVVQIEPREDAARA